MAPTSYKASLADGSGSARTPDSAHVRALDSYMLLSKKVDRVSQELDNLPVLVSRVTVSDEDSLIISIKHFETEDERG